MWCGCRSAVGFTLLTLESELMLGSIKLEKKSQLGRRKVDWCSALN